MPAKKNKAKVRKARSTRDSAKPVRRSAARKPVRLPDLADWRQIVLERIRALIVEADPDIVEERKWRKPSNPAGVPTWSHDGIVCTGESYKSAVKLTFARGASLEDPLRLFNAGLDGNVRRAIDIKQGETIDAEAFKALIRAAVAFNSAKKRG
jgi:hypothetical protein